MKSFNKKISWLLLLALLPLGGCASTPVTIPALSASEVTLDRGREVKADACGLQLLLFIPIMINDRQTRAFNALKAQAGPDALANLGVRESWGYAFVGTVYCTHLEATAYPKMKTPGS